MTAIKQHVDSYQQLTEQVKEHIKAQLVCEGVEFEALMENSPASRLMCIAECLCLSIVKT